MKSRIVLTQILLLATFISCNKEKQERKVTCTNLYDYAYSENCPIGSLCTTSICNEYQAIWKELFLEKNNLSESYFNDHIILCQSDTITWMDGISFSICYKVKIGWAIAWNCDQFIIKIKNGNSLYPSINIPRDEYLSKENIRIAIDNHAFSSNMTAISNDEVLKFTNSEIALDKMIKDANVSTLCTRSVFINDLGHISIEANAEYVNEVNLCIVGTIDLINGNTHFYDTMCRIY
ncbi:MAG: hypothetical protein HOO91_12960 [Bacteroidales bacterium]|nr:hypothetical protein [Bacteroidales bacterium]